MSTAPTEKKMTYVRLGKSGLKVSKLILGCMTYGTPDGNIRWALGEEDAYEHIKIAYDAGINTFDTADIYSNGLSEVILGKAIKKLALPRDGIVVMTKLFAAVGHEYTSPLQETMDENGYVNERGLGRKHIFAGIKRSLDRLQLDYVDVLQCHRFDPDTPIEETMRALHDVVQAGYARYIGMSSCYAWQFQLMQNYAIANHLTPFISMQNCYSLVYREEEREMMPTLSHFGVGSIPWSPLARGVLTRPWAPKPAGEGTKREQLDEWAVLLAQGDADKLVVDRLEEVAKRLNASMAQTALAWLAAKPGVTAPIVGTSSIANLRDLLGALDVTLSAEDVKYLDEPYKPKAIAGHY
ncbi:Aldo keto reductase [Athelia psychrophila]|uniref:Aldo keto reductase n=1 Tax=Athelia psychrophila TaxID=1759441 RepID=A0A166RT27_9AGAM|nr:Aldo keto reductase [Fibularhizoctonia sp. CBS 109695]